MKDHDIVMLFLRAYAKGEVNEGVDFEDLDEVFGYALEHYEGTYRAMVEEEKHQ
jgi:hypothetical protein